MNRNLIVYIAASVDGFIAAPGDDLSFLSAVEQPGEDYGYAAFTQTVDTVIMGRRTYDWVMGQVAHFPHAGKETYILTRSPRPAEGKVQFYNGPLNTLVNELKQKEGKNIFVDGGAQVVNSLLQQQAVDEIILSLIPVLLGNGTRLFQEGFTQQKLLLHEVKRFDSGLVQLHYKKATVRSAD